MWYYICCLPGAAHGGEHPCTGRHRFLWLVWLVVHRCFLGLAGLAGRKWSAMFAWWCGRKGAAVRSCGLGITPARRPTGGCSHALCALLCSSVPACRWLVPLGCVAVSLASSWRHSWHRKASQVSISLSRVVTTVPRAVFLWCASHRLWCVGGYPCAYSYCWLLHPSRVLTCVGPHWWCSACLWQRASSSATRAVGTQFKHEMHLVGGHLKEQP
jgi:hypothetical protein